MVPELISARGARAPRCPARPESAGWSRRCDPALTHVLCPLPRPVLWLRHERRGLQLHPLPGGEVFQRRLPDMQAPQRLRGLLPGHCADAGGHGERRGVRALSPRVSSGAPNRSPGTAHREPCGAPGGGLGAGPPRAAVERHSCRLSRSGGRGAAWHRGGHMSAARTHGIWDGECGPLSRAGSPPRLSFSAL